MPLKIKNIDKQASLPEGIHFRKELIWEKVQTRKKTRIFWPWAVASVVILGLGLSFLIHQAMRPVQKIEVTKSVSVAIDDRPASENLPAPDQTSPLIRRNPLVQTPEKKPARGKSDKKEENPLEIPDLQSFSLQPTSSIRLASIDSTLDPLTEVKSLSPAASRFQKSIQKMNPTQTSQQAVFVERFDFIKIIQRQPLQASSNSNTNSGLNSLFHGKIQQN